MKRILTLIIFLHIFLIGYCKNISKAELSFKNNFYSTSESFNTPDTVLPAADTISYSGATTFCLGGSVILTANNPPARATYQWLNNGTAIVPAEIGQTYTATTSGKYSVVVISSGDSVIYNFVTVIVNPNPTAGFTPSSNNQCSNVLIHFTNTSGGASSYSWNFGDPNSNKNTSTSANPTHQFIGTTGSSTQSFNVVLTSKNNFGCTATNTQTINSSQLPDAHLGGTGASNYIGLPYFKQCQSTTSSFTFTNSSSTTATNTSYRVIWGDGSPDYSSPTFNAPITHTYNVGTHTINYIVAGNFGCIDTTVYYVFVGVDPNVGLAGGASNICTGTSLTFFIDQTLTSLNPPGTLYTATFNDGTPPVIDSQPPPLSVSHTFDSTSCGAPAYSNYTNAFFASVVASNPCGTKEAIIVPIYVSTTPVASFLIAPSDTVCISKSVTLTNTSSNNYVDGSGNCINGNLVWSISPSTGWVLASGILGNDFGLSDPSTWTSGSNNLLLNFTASGTYTIKLKAGGNPNLTCLSDSITKTICVNQLPVANFSIDQNLGCAPLNVLTTNNPNPTTCGNNSYTWSVSYSPTAGCLPNTSGFSYINGTNANSINPQFQFTNPGIYTISLVTTGPAGGCISLPFTQTVTVKGKPGKIAQTDHPVAF